MTSQAIPDAISSTRLAQLQDELKQLQLAREGYQRFAFSLKHYQFPAHTLSPVSPENLIPAMKGIISASQECAQALTDTIKRQAEVEKDLRNEKQLAKRQDAETPISLLSDRLSSPPTQMTTLSMTSECGGPVEIVLKYGRSFANMPDFPLAY